MATLLLDLKYGLRMLTKNPGFTAVAVVTLALGIGANAAIFSVVDAVLLRSLSLPYKDPDRLVYVYIGDVKHGGFDDDISMADFVDWKNQNHVFEQMAAFQGAWFTLTGDTEPQRIHGDFITVNWLPTLGVNVSRGRNFMAEEERPGHNRVVILSNDCWQRRFNADPNMIGKKLTLNGQALTVVGILPASFGFDDREVFVAFPLANYWSDRRTLGAGHALARLKPHTTLQQAQAEMETIAHQLELEYPTTNKNRAVRLKPMIQAASELPPTPRRMHQSLWVMFGAVGLVTLMACANVANLLLARGVTRQKEFVMRIALGSTRGRITRQLLTESVLLYLCGGATGFVFAEWSRNLIVKITGTYLGATKVVLNSRIFLFSLGVSLLTGLVFGLAPALQAARIHLKDALKDSIKVAAGGWRRNRARFSLIISEISLVMVLLVGFGLLMRSFMRVLEVPLGLDPRNVLTISAGLDQPKYASVQEQLSFSRRILGEVRQLPAVQYAGITDSLPLDGAVGIRFSIEGQPLAPEGSQLPAKRIAISADFFHALSIPLLAGRQFMESDTAAAPPVAIINQTMARRYFPGENPLGKRLRMGDSSEVWREIAGVIADVRQRNLDEDSAPIIYQPWYQAPETDLRLAVHTISSADSQRVAASLRTKLQTLDKDQVWGHVKTMEQNIDESESVSLRRPVVMLLGTFGMIALILAVIGIYGVLSYSVRERTREMGIRIALGARPNAILNLILRQTTLLSFVGMSVGIVAALLLTRLLPTGPVGWSGGVIHLYGVTRTDAITYGGVSLTIAAVALAASYIPARRATKVDPMVALRYE